MTTKGGQANWIEWGQTALAVLAVVGLGLLAVGCGRSAENPAETEKPNLSIWYSGFQEDSMENALQTISTKNTLLSSKKISPDKFEAETVDAIAADEDPDVWIMPNDWLPDHQNKLLPIGEDIWPSDVEGGATTTSENFKATFYDFIAEDLIKDGKVIAFPGPVQTLVLYKNQSLFSDTWQEWNQNNPDSSDEAKTYVSKLLTSQLKTWDEVTKAASLLTKRNGDQITRSGIALGTSGNIPESDDILQLLIYQQGGKVVNAIEKIALFDGFEKTASGELKYPGRDALTFYSSFSNPQSPHYTWNSSMPNAREAFLKGQLAMLIDYPEFSRTIRQEDSQLDFETSLVPQLNAEENHVNFATYYVYGPTKASQDPGYALALAKEMAGTVDFTLSLLATMDDATLPFKENSLNGLGTEQVINAKSVYKKNHQKFDETFKSMIEDVSIRGQSVENAINRGADIITRLLRDEI